MPDPLHLGIDLTVEVVGESVGGAAPQKKGQGGEEERVYWWLAPASDHCCAKSDEGKQDSFTGL